MRGLGATTLTAAVGPCIQPGCYEFSPADLDAVVAAVGPHVRGATSAGHPALDLPGGVRAALAAAVAEVVADDSRCTACAPELFSHRGGDRERQAVVAWLT
jgi:copper oxidase (laccase) domain-containing protein